MFAKSASRVATADRAVPRQPGHPTGLEQARPVADAVLRGRIDAPNRTLMPS